MTTRKDLYLKKLGDGAINAPPPVTTEEKILSELAGVGGLGIELPSVTSTDEGKVLKVVNGAWTASDSSGGLSNIVDADNGGTIEGLLDVGDIDSPEWADPVNPNSATGENAHVEGGFVYYQQVPDASVGGYYISNENVASGKCSHAEGAKNIASGNFSHAEGQYNTANYVCAHAEGFNTTASSDSAHAEGGHTVASGYLSHAEGGYTKANGSYSHAGGNGTIADGYAQTVIGTNNIAQGTANSKTSTDYAFIIGNGTGNTKSNAFAIKWDGTFVFANGTEITPAQFETLLGLLQ